ncbi:TetR/AcrR family transcriptional regulator [Streptomyces sp. NBC_01754]|uniref:TetR/AcrR family transcriptional regulator n=1 Tax=Streptomyces sp. NBC_01754 TaxID=2975930 RepID=UPI002DD7DB61|nr:TetR/AcrR family transcriptional regulator [Streptomyces sp. NBC_01754]WSC94732.1 TetR/AcrR family transcriptional regulator [Streptomyces sp. NBC_01754]
MPTAREALLDAAVSALVTRPWGEVRMGEVAAAAGVSRQTLYHAFGSKHGLGRALIRRAADGYLAGVEEALGTHAVTGRGPVELALWTVRAARGDAIVKALLTGHWDDDLPRPEASHPARAAAGAETGARSGAGTAEFRIPLPTPAELLTLARDRAVAVLRNGRTSRGAAADLESVCEIALRIGLSYAVVPPVAAPSPVGSDAVRLVREALARLPAP